MKHVHRAVQFGTGATAIAAISALGLAASSPPAQADTGGDCPAQVLVNETYPGGNGEDVHVISGCGYQVEAALEWRVCMPDAENLGQTCTMALWAYGNSVSTGGTSKVNVGDVFGMQEVNSGYRYKIGSNWIQVSN
jgi:hypothetical protein